MSRLDPARQRLLWRIAAISATVVALDQATKALVVARMALRERIAIVPGFFDLTYVTNPGGVWSVGADLAGPWRTAIFLALPAAITAFALMHAWSLPPGARVRQAAIALVVGGAVGNLIDRLFRTPPEVVDFVLLHYRRWAWPAFNVADMAICVGVGVLLVASFSDDADDDGEDDPAASGTEDVSVPSAAAPPPRAP